MSMMADAAAQGRVSDADAAEEQSPVRTLDWLLGDLVERVAGAQHALLLSADGLLLSASPDLDHERGERLAAIASGFASLARGARGQLGAAEVRQTVVEMDSVFFFVLAAGRGASLALVAASTCDMGQAAFEVNRLVRQVGPHLSALPRRGGRGGGG
ncbi:roadblock/LC7 domain-containing protein [Nocardiopsis quinghaiensis]|uniref:roadblock/LC7 domain-containing protein n=1 Tax=Nocardiopsis quinghaiensis TaxID=464995 RepID=UPI00123C603B|nr:roadblock/LC7 domain-containing protein [Nocardiopsis quinghaiensis]